MDVFSIPVIDKLIVYAPLHGFLALVNEAGAQDLQRGLVGNAPSRLFSSQVLGSLRSPGALPLPARGASAEPAFLGLIPTRGCNARCRYCDFQTLGLHGRSMSLSLAREAIQAYLLLKQKSGAQSAEIHFFGGEPFCAEDVVQVAVEFASTRAAQMGMQVHFEATTNGLYRAALAKWIADRFGAVVLSLDGPRDIQDAQRPARGRPHAFDTVVESAGIFSHGPVDLILRACITSRTVNRMQEIAQWFAEKFSPSSVCFEALTPTEAASQAGLEPPDPWAFAEHFHRAAEVLGRFGIRAVHATAAIDTARTSFCPLGKDALIVSPEGAISACYLPEGSWKRRRLDLTLGRVQGEAFNIPESRLAHIRNLNVESRRLCADCFCRFHCAGGCYVNHDTTSEPGRFGPLCIQTRLLTTANLLERLEQHGLVEEWMADREMMERTVWRTTDRLCETG